MPSGVAGTTVIVLLPAQVAFPVRLALVKYEAEEGRALSLTCRQSSDGDILTVDLHTGNIID